MIADPFRTPDHASSGPGNVFRWRSPTIHISRPPVSIGPNNRTRSLLPLELRPLPFVQGQARHRFSIGTSRCGPRLVTVRWYHAADVRRSIDPVRRGVIDARNSRAASAGLIGDCAISFPDGRVMNPAHSPEVPSLRRAGSWLAVTVNRHIDQRRVSPAASS